MKKVIDVMREIDCIDTLTNILDDYESDVIKDYIEDLISCLLRYRTMLKNMKVVTDYD